MPNTAATPTATGRETRWPSTTSGALKRRASTMPYSVAIAAMAPYAAASFAEDVATGNVAAKVSISRDGSHPNSIPPPVMTPTTASSTTHDQW
jgi:hypothetical protein